MPVCVIDQTIDTDQGICSNEYFFYQADLGTEINEYVIFNRELRLGLLQRDVDGFVPLGVKNDLVANFNRPRILENDRASEFNLGTNFLDVLQLPAYPQLLQAPKTSPILLRSRCRPGLESSR